VNEQVGPTSNREVGQGERGNEHGGAETVDFVERALVNALLGASAAGAWTTVTALVAEIAARRNRRSR
jgi:hypothetical protein